jgi:hypothetical protein
MRAVALSSGNQLRTGMLMLSGCMAAVEGGSATVPYGARPFPGEPRMFQVMIVAKVSTGSHLAVTSQLADCDTREQADALCEGVEKQNKDSRALPGFSAATIKLYQV